MTSRIAIITALTLVGSPASAETLTNRSVLELTGAGVETNTIVDKIASSDGRFDLSTAQIIMLKKRGVPAAVISAMIAADARTRGVMPAASRPIPSGPARNYSASSLASPRPAGIYLQSNGQLERIDFNVSGQTKTGGLLGTMMTGGIAHTSVKTVLQGAAARVRTSEKMPTFFFYLPNAANEANMGSFEAASTTPTSPNEFSLVRLTVSGNRREARVGRANIGGVSSGVSDRDRVDFDYSTVRPGVFTVKPKVALAPGEYSFMAIGSGGARTARFFDFSIQP